MKKQLFISAIMLIGFFITIKTIDCISTPTEVEASYGDSLNMEYIGGSGDIDEYKDSETGVHYFIYGNVGGITVRYNSDGTIYTDYVK